MLTFHRPIGLIAHPAARIKNNFRRFHLEQHLRKQAEAKRLAEAILGRVNHIEATQRAAEAKRLAEAITDTST